MEAAGLGIGVAGLAGLLSSVREAKEMVDSYRAFGRESRPVDAQRAAARVLLQQWSKNVGYGQDLLEDDHHEALDDPGVREVVDQIVQCFQDLDPGTDNRPADPSLPPREQGRRLRNPSVSLPGPVQTGKSQKPTSRRTKFAWAFQDKKKSSDQTQQVAALLQMLRELVPPPDSHGPRNAQVDPGTVDPLQRAGFVMKSAFTNGKI